MCIVCVYILCMQEPSEVRGGAGFTRPGGTDDCEPLCERWNQT